MTLNCGDIIQNVLAITNNFSDMKNLRNYYTKSYFEKPLKEIFKKVENKSNRCYREI